MNGGLKNRVALLVLATALVAISPTGLWANETATALRHKLEDAARAAGVEMVGRRQRARLIQTGAIFPRCLSSPGWKLTPL